MKIKQLLLATIASASLSSCSSSISARYSYDSDVDYSDINSYAWAAAAPLSFSTPESAEHFVKTMEDMLAAKGFKLDTENPDFLLSTQGVSPPPAVRPSLNVPKQRSQVGNGDVLGSTPQARIRHRHRDLPAMRRPAARHRQHRGTGGDRADSQAPWPGGRAGRCCAPEPGTAPVRSADLTPSPMPTPPGHRAGTGAC